MSTSKGKGKGTSMSTISSTISSANMALALALAAAGTGLLSGCPRIGPQCGAGQSACGTECVDLQADPANCGTCGTVCGDNQECAAGGCRCRATAATCGGSACLDLQTDPGHCGSCTRACPEGHVCASGDCVISCQAFGLAQCGSSCVDLSASAQHCGTCGNACAGSQSCRRGICTYDVIAACFSTDQLVGISASNDARGPLVSVPTTPESLASMGRSLLVGAAFTGKLHQLSLRDFSPRLEADGGTVTTGIGPDARHVLVDGELVYVANAGDNTLQILRRTGAEDPVRGNALATVSQVSFGPNANPQAVAKVGTDLFVPLYGSFSGAQGEAAGGLVARVNAANPAQPAITRRIDLRQVDLHPFGTSSHPRPSWITVWNGALYVPLNNLDGFAVGGPGMMARIDPVTEQVTGIELGPTCLNAIYAAASPRGVLVGCAGESDYSNFPDVVTVKTGVVLVSGDQVVASWEARCPPGDGGCADPSIARVHSVGAKVYAGDQAAGRLFVLDATDGGLSERRGYADGGTPIDLCPLNAWGYSNVADLHSP